MATAKKLPSGQWRVRAYVGTDASGKKITMSFTAPTKRDAELAAAQYVAQNKPTTGMELTVRDAIERYITAKTPVLSASTIRVYRTQQRRYYDGIADKKVFRLTTEDMQLFISDLTGKVSAKSVANIYGLLSSSVAFFRPDAVFRVTLPKKQKQRRISPSDSDIQRLFEEADNELKKCIALSAFGSLRRGEVCALKHGDISGRTVTVHADLIQDEHYQWIYKPFPKTSDSNREVTLPQEVIDLIGDGVDDEFIISITPAKVTGRFIALRDRLGLPDIRFHDLRHYYASIGAVLGIPDTYLSLFGGWQSGGNNVMKRVYQNIISDEKVKYENTLNAHFSGLFSR